MQRLRARIEGRSRYFLLRTQHGVEGMPHGTIGRPGLFVIVLLAGSRSNNEISLVACHYAIVISVELPVNNGHIPHMKGFVLKVAGPFQPYTGFFFIAFVQPYGSREFTLQQLDLTVGNLQLVEFRRPSSVVPNAHALVAPFDKTAWSATKIRSNGNTL